MRDQITDADRLHAAAQIDEPVNDARTSGSGLASAEIRRRCARHQRMNPRNGRHDEQRCDADYEWQ